MNFSKDAMDKGYPFVNLQNIFGRNVIDTDNLGLAEASDNQLKEYNLQEGDVLFVRSSVKLEGVGEAAIVPKNLENTTYSGFVIRFRDETDMDINFKRFIFGTKPIRDQIMAKATNSANKNISQDVLNNLELYLPLKMEQQKIGEYFSNIDNLITLHQRLYRIANHINLVITISWEQRKLEEVVEDYVEKTTVEDQYPVLTSSQQKGIVLQDEYFSGERVSQNGNIGYFVIPRGYFAFRSRSDNDVFVFNRNDAVDMGIISYFYPVFKPKGVDSDFLLRRLNYGLEDQIKINSEGTGQHVLSLKKFKNMIGGFPSYEEQQKIGAYFKQLDNLITLHQRKCIFYRYILKTWEQRKFGDLGSVAMCRRIFKEQTSNEGDVPFFKIGTFGGEPDAFIDRALFDEYKAAYPYPEVGDILVSASGTIGRTVEYTGADEYFQDSNIVWFKHGNDVKNEFLKILYEIVKWNGIEGTTIKRLYNDNFLKTEFMLPSVEEQTKIGVFFEHIDNLITLHRRTSL